MVFSSSIFLFLFLPIVFAVYFAITLKRGSGSGLRLANLWLLLASVFFYFWGEQWLVWIVIASSLIDYTIGYQLGRTVTPRGESKLRSLPVDGPRTTWQKTLLGASVVSNLSFLAFFKYADFAIENLAGLGEAMGASWLQMKSLGIALPLGISFYTFQSMSYTIDVYRGRVTPSQRPIDFGVFITFFSQLVAGPIVRYRDLEAQLSQRAFRLDPIYQGALRFIVGLAKKVLIADHLGRVVESIDALPLAEVSTSMSWLASICYTLQIFFDFSGYSDMAIGLAAVLGFRLNENFDQPYRSKSITEFWRRWHISLSTWFRDYLYIPLGGNRGSPLKTYRNLIVVFLLCGLWHGASWNFVAWGMMHGGFLVFERFRNQRRGDAASSSSGSNPNSRFRGGLGLIYTFAIVHLSWVLFRVDGMSEAMAHYRKMLFPSATDLATDHALSIHNYMTGDVLAWLLIGAVCAVFPRERLARLRGSGWLGELAIAVGAFLLLWLAVANVVANSYSPFIYFRF